MVMFESLKGVKYLIKCTAMVLTVFQAKKQIPYLTPFYEIPHGRHLEIQIPQLQQYICKIATILVSLTSEPSRIFLFFFCKIFVHIYETTTDL